MDYKALYGIVFSPIILAIIYMSYLHYTQGDDTQLLNKTDTNMTTTKENNFEQISPEEFKSELNSGDSILIDVRRPEEQEQYGVISENQLTITLGTDSFSEEILKLDKTKKYLVYCWHGQRSVATRDFMQENGFTWVKDLQGGIDDWEY